MRTLQRELAISDLTYSIEMDEEDKPVVWIAGEVKTPPFSKEARIEAGVLLRRLRRKRKPF